MGGCWLFLKERTFPNKNNQKRIKNNEIDIINRYKEHLKSFSEFLKITEPSSVQNIKWRKPHKPPVKPWDTNRPPKTMGELNGFTPLKTKMTGWKIHYLKMYFLLNMGIFQCHVGFQGCRLLDVHHGCQKNMKQVHHITQDIFLNSEASLRDS